MHQSDGMAVPAETSISRTAEQSRRATLAAYFGSMLEYYDYFIYASAAALVFGTVFFPAAGDLSLLISLTSFGVAYVARPFGALLWGHFGDKLSRKQVLMMTLVMMGTATLVIGLIPSYEQIGIAAPIVLMLMRIVQGISAAGETAGAVSLVVESSGESRKAFNASWIQSGNLSGFILANLVFVPIAMLPDEQLMSWGWRIPFLFSAALIVLGFVIRRGLEDPAEFIEAKSESTESVSPLRELARNHKGAVLTLAALGLFQGTHTMVTVFGLAYATKVVGLASSTVLWMLVAVSALALVTVPFGGWLSDRIGCKPVFLYGSLVSIPAFAFYLWSFTTGNLVLMYVAAILTYALVYSIGNGSTMALFAGQFDVRVRYSGLAIGMQLAGLVFGFAPSVAIALVGGDPKNWIYAALAQATLCLVASIGCIFARENPRTSASGIDASAKEDANA
ncbi:MULTISPECIES: MFS transporter [Rhodococcus]|uniref:MFS transporter n=1 Tax=Rhodococcus TaxID=1827 RepID=UPI00120A3E29|nr:MULTISPECIES: MFS transporter [Rhodococcus]QXW01288.1 MHS family MFS transporter [Rhodococcus globerulus]RZL24615.1 MAG: MFS transporter [Rhodococcus sp. (in: high G+C Gram-positive bacteria)]